MGASGWRNGDIDLQFVTEPLQKKVLTKRKRSRSAAGMGAGGCRSGGVAGGGGVITTHNDSSHVCDIMTMFHTPCPTHFTHSAAACPPPLQSPGPTPTSCRWCSAQPHAQSLLPHFMTMVHTSCCLCPTLFPTLQRPAPVPPRALALPRHRAAGAEPGPMQGGRDRVDGQQGAIRAQVGVGGCGLVWDRVGEDGSAER